LNFGGHTNRFAYYTSLNGNRTNLGLETPTSAVIHDQANGYGGFTSLTYNLDAQNQLRLVAQLRQDYYQVPFDPNHPSEPGQFQSDSNKERDGFVLFTWVRTFSPGLVLTVSPFYHHNNVNYASSPLDQPSSATETLSSNYEGGQANLSWIAKRNNLRAGVSGFGEQSSQLFGLVCNKKPQCIGLNEPTTMECARNLAKLTLEKGGETDDSRIAYAFRRCVSREPTGDEKAELLQFCDKQKKRLADGWLNAWQLLGENAPNKPDDKGEKPAGAIPAGCTPTEFAAWTCVARTLLNLDETITKE